MNSQRVPLPEVSDLIAPGQPLPFKVLDSAGRLLLAAGQSVMDGKQLAALLERGACVEYADVRAVREARQAAAGNGLLPGQRPQTWFDRWEQQTRALEALLRVFGRDADQARLIEACADALIALVDSHADAALFQCIRQDDRRFALYALHHGLHAATLALLAARNLGWPEARARLAVLVALTMNASIVDLQAQMAEQPDPPTRKQIEQLRAHPQRSAQLLRDAGVSDVDWLAAVEEHHERPDGTGYPLGISAVGDLAHLVRAADVFMAKISPRALRAPLLPQQAARQLFQDENGGPLAAALIKAIGVYPPGDFVRLKNGEAAIVAQRAAPGMAPVVVVVLNAQGRPVPGAPRRNTGQGEFGIIGPLQERQGLPRVLPEQVYGLVP